MYNDEDMLMLSGIQHFMFCPRQWALIHIEQQWDDNRLTIEGELLHKHVDDPSYRAKSGEIICLRAVSVASKALGLYGVADVIELYPSSIPDNTIRHPKYKGYWLPRPIEYKHGKPKRDMSDQIQLCAQAMCLEEQYRIVVDYGEIFYGQTRRREQVVFTRELRDMVAESAQRMHQIFQARLTPRAEFSVKCRQCSLIDICMPDQQSSAANYLARNLYEETA